MANLLRLLMLTFVAIAIADPSIDPIGVRVTFSRGLENDRICTTEDQATIVDILEVALASAPEHGKLRAPSVSKSCVKECKGHKSGTCYYVDAHCFENSDAEVSFSPDEQEETETMKPEPPVATGRTISRELQDLCRTKKRQVISILKREITSSDLSGQCKAFVGGGVTLACHFVE